MGWVAIAVPVIENIYKFQPTVTYAATRNVSITPARGEVNTSMLCPAKKELIYLKQKGSLEVYLYLSIVCSIRFLNWCV